MDALGRQHAGVTLEELGWTFAFDRARTRLGLCTWRRGRLRMKRISLSRPLSERLGWDVMEDVVRHEIAHALDYEERGRSAHDARWKAWAVRCGADPTATYDGPLGDDPRSPLVGECPSTECAYRRPLYRVPLRVPICGECRRQGLTRPLSVFVRDSGRPVAVGAAAARWVGTCPACAARIPFARRPAGRRACAACCRRAGGRFDARFALRIARQF
jgi:predicted SprT family Zn-dependent metalloprotease